jgi:uncharacterized membrane protein YdjX (TVP38/TMEM64 family)
MRPRQIFKHILDQAKSHRLQIIGLGFWFMLLGVGQLYASSQNLSVESLGSAVRSLLLAQFWGPTLLIVVYGLRPLTLIPSSLLTILAGNVFGVFPGIVYALLGGVVSALIPYFAGYLTASPVRKEEPHRVDHIVQRLIAEVNHHPFQAVFVSRLLYPPYDVVNYLFGTVRVPFRKFVAATLSGNLIGAFVYVGIGASVEGSIAADNLQLNGTLLSASLIALAASLVIMALIRRRSAAARLHNRSQ